MTISIRKDWKTSKAHYHSITYVQSAYSWLMNRKSNICKKNSITSKNCPLKSSTSCAMPSLPQTFATSSSHPYSSRYADLLLLLHRIAPHFKTDSLHLHKRFIDSLLQSTCSSSLLPEHLVCLIPSSIHFRSYSSIHDTSLSATELERYISSLVDIIINNELNMDMKSLYVCY